MDVSSIPDPLTELLNEFSIINITVKCEKSKTEDCVQLYEDICTYVSAYGGWFQLTDYWNDSWSLGATMLVSSMLGLIFFGFIYYTKELQVHPMKLIMFLALSESAFQF